MGIIFDTENTYLTNFLDIIVIFTFGLLLLFFSNVIQNEGKFLMIYMSVIVICVILFNMSYTHSKLKRDDKETNVFNVLTFINIYVMILMLLISGMTFYLWSKKDQ